jgi:hypothetical protein
MTKAVLGKQARREKMAACTGGKKTACWIFIGAYEVSGTLSGGSGLRATGADLSSDIGADAPIRQRCSVGSKAGLKIVPQPGI